MNRYIALLPGIFYVSLLIAQDNIYWQQSVKYIIKADVDVKTHSLKGVQKVFYYNNSPDTIDKVYFHLYYNAFQPNSMMAHRALKILDPERDIEKEFSELKLHNSGKVDVRSLKQNDSILNFEIFETILKTKLNQPLPPGDSAVFDLEYLTTIPKLIRRAGRDSDEGIDYSMAQWYPKIVAYDDEGFHADVYIGREFYGVFGDFEVYIDIDNKYKVAAGANLIDTLPLDGKKKRYHFEAKNVHDFVWAADRDYVQYSVKADSLTTFMFFFQDIGKRKDAWLQLGSVMKEAFGFMNKRYGRYPYRNYNFIEGGDGGMEYPLATLITGDRNLNSLVGISVHEFMHAWYHTSIATNESSYPWMDEGFTSFATIEVLQFLASKGLIEREFPDFPYQNDYNVYKEYVNSFFYEPMNIHSDHFSTNYAYSISAYISGMIFLKQLEYIVGKQAFDAGLLQYFIKWKFKSPKPIDVIRVMEKTSDLELKWYLDYFVNRPGAIDYCIDTVYQKKKYLIIDMSRISTIPMPVDIQIEFADGSKKNYSIPLDLMLGSKLRDKFEFEVLPAWKWTNSGYSLKFDNFEKEVLQIIIDPTLRMADIERSNNIWNLKEKKLSK